MIADYLSRNPLATTDIPDTVEEVELFVDCARSQMPVSDQRLQEIREATASDNQHQLALKYTRAGWPEYYKDVPEEVREFYAARGNLSEHNGLLLFKDRIAIPESLRSDILDKLHDGHQGVTKC